MRNMLTLGLLSAALLTLVGCAPMQSYGGGYQQPTMIEVAKVVNIQNQASEGGWKTGAAVGGVAGVLTGGGHSTESKVIRGVAGALIGGAVQKAFTTGNQETYVVVQTRYGQTYNLQHASNDLIPGDCVQLEKRYNGDIRVFRTSPTQCSF